MAEYNYYVSAFGFGGSALKDAIASLSTLKSSDLVYLHTPPGVYDGGLMLYSSSKVPRIWIVGEQGKEDETIIDGHLSTFCIRSGRGSTTRHSCSHVTLRNGFVSDRTATLSAEWGNCPIGKDNYVAAAYGTDLFCCNIIDCVVDIENVKRSVPDSPSKQFVAGGVLRNCGLSSCYLSGNITPCRLIHGGYVCDSDISYNEQRAKDPWNDALFVECAAYGCKFHHNKLSAHGLGTVGNSLIYENDGSGSKWSEVLQRGQCIASTIVGNKNFSVIDDTYGGELHYINCAFANNTTTADKLFDFAATLTNNTDILFQNCVFDTSRKETFGAQEAYVNMALTAPEALFYPSNNVLIDTSSYVSVDYVSVYLSTNYETEESSYIDITRANLNNYIDIINELTYLSVNVPRSVSSWIYVYDRNYNQYKSVLSNYMFDEYPVKRGGRLSNIMIDDLTFEVPFEEYRFVDADAYDYRLCGDSFLTKKTAREKTLNSTLMGRARNASGNLKGIVRQLSAWANEGIDKVCLPRREVNGALGAYEYYKDPAPKVLSVFYNLQ